MDDPIVVEVRLWGERVGAVADLPGRPGYYNFEYSPEFLRQGLEPAPLMMPLRRGTRYAFPALDPATFYGLPGLLADSLPDRFGNALIDEYLSRRGVPIGKISALQRLIYVGRRAMGAIEYEPALRDLGRPESAVPLEMARLVEESRQALRGTFPEVAQDIIDVGSSAGGARAKAVVGWNPATGELLSGQFELPPGFEHWLLKFDGVGDRGVDGASIALGATNGFGRIEYAHYLMAREAGIAMSECRLFEEGGRAHFMTRRFDREGGAKLHVQTLCAMRHLDFNMPYVHGYEQYFRTILELNLGNAAIEEAWRRAVFNVLCRNCDDHTKNVAFLLRPTGRWELAPAYDLCFAHNPAPGRWTRQHQMLIAGKAQGITKADLVELGARFGVRRPMEKYGRVLEAVRRWPQFAKAAGVPDEAAAAVARYQELG
jgi:serine/threonine-protein kinase HipA